MKKMKLSNNFRFLKITTSNYVVFDNFAVDIHFISVSVFKLLIKGDFKNIPKTDLSILLEKKIIFLSESEENIFIESKINYVNKKMESVNSLYISFTQRCNLTCNHCHFPKREFSLENIDDSKIRNMINIWMSYIFENNPKNKEELWVIPYGGDPLLRKDLLFLLLYYIKEMKIKSKLYKNVKVYLPTNADIMTTDDLCKFSEFNFLHIAFGLDGDNYVHCSSKNVSDEQFYSLCEKIKMSVVLNIDISISVIGSIELFNNFDNFLQLVKDLGIKKMAINFVRNVKVNTNEYLKSLNFIYEKYYDELLLLEFQLKNRIEIIKMKLPFRIDCPCYGKQFTLFPDSSVGVCPFEKKGVVNIDTFIGLSHEEKTKIKNLNKSEYYNLSVKNGFIYGGGCHWSHCQSSQNKSFDELVNKKIFSIIFKKIYNGKK